MRIGVLTSSRADFGIYLPLLKAIKKDSFFDLGIIAFGTHLSDFHGKSINQIAVAGFEIKYTVESMLLTDSANAISTAMGLTMIKFAEFWKEHGEKFDLVLSLGDRYEMFAAVMAAIPFQIKFAHLHGGEKTMGAIDNIFRHAISHASNIHFTSTQIYKDRLRNMLDENKLIFNVGALSLENLNDVEILSIADFEAKWGVNFKYKTILITFHPETLKVDENVRYAQEIIAVINARSDYQYLITMPNADTAGNLVRTIFINELSKLENVFLIENLGTQSYFSAITHAKFLLGNTSSGIIEAASFGKYVINLGNRQEGRACSDNVFNVEIEHIAILERIKEIEELGVYNGTNIYKNENAISLAICELKNYANVMPKQTV